MPNLEMFLLAVVQALLLLAMTPLMTGISRMMRARMHSRRGPGVLQDYRDIIKLLKRQDVASGASGLVFRATPYIIFSAMMLLAMALPALTRHAPLGVASDLITFIYLFALVRFELTLGVLVEPTMILSLLVVALIEGTTNIGAIGAGIGGNYLQTPLAIVLAMLAFGFVVFIEMGKLPFDMAEAEQELQEGPLTEYSGSALALLKIGLGLKKLVMAQFFLGVFLPFGCAEVLNAPSLLIALIALPLKLIVVFVLTGLVENSMARTRFMLTSKVTWVGFGLSALSFVFYLTGL